MKLDENFQDGKNPERKGLAKRSGVNTKASISDLRKTAKNSSGEKQRMAHWLANMKSGRKKAKKINEIAPLAAIGLGARLAAPHIAKAVSRLGNPSSQAGAGTATMAYDQGKKLVKRLKNVYKNRKVSGVKANEEAPPGRKDQVKALKDKFGDKAAFAIAWSQHNKHGKPTNEDVPATSTANVASHNNFQLGIPATDKRYKNGKTVLLKRFRAHAQL